MTGEEVKLFHRRLCSSTLCLTTAPKNHADYFVWGCARGHSFTMKFLELGNSMQAVLAQPESPDVSDPDPR